MRWLRAPAKINLTLRVIGRRADGYHDLESLVAFAGLCDWIGFEPGRDLALEVVGPKAIEAGPADENLVVRAARALAPHIGQKLGRFRLVKRLPAAAGLGGGSADAAAALCGCSPTRPDCRSTTHGCTLRPERRERTFSSVLIRMRE